MNFLYTYYNKKKLDIFLENNLTAAEIQTSENTSGNASANILRDVNQMGGQLQQNEDNDKENDLLIEHSCYKDTIIEKV